MKEKFEKFSKFFISMLGKLILLAGILFVLFNLGKSVWKNYQNVEMINTKKLEITKLENENQNLKNLNMYYQTDSFKEIEARSKLDYKKPGENVLIIPELSGNNKELTTEDVNKNEEPKAEIPNAVKWYHFIIN
jgi:cell division protein FtsB